MSSSFTDRVWVTDDLDYEMRHWQRMYQNDIIITPAGPFVIRREDFFTLCRPARRTDFAELFSSAMSHGRDFVATESHVQVETKVPWELLAQATQFFRSVWKQYHREDILLLYYYFDERRYELVHPVLTDAHETHVGYDFPLTPDGAVRFGSLHLHGHENAHHSAWDAQDDDVSAGVHVVIGSMEAPLPTIACVYSDGQRSYKVSLNDVFEEPPCPDVPEEWFVANVPRVESHHRRERR